MGTPMLQRRGRLPYLREELLEGWVLREVCTQRDLVVENPMRPENSAWFLPTAASDPTTMSFWPL